MLGIRAGWDNENGLRHMGWIKVWDEAFHWEGAVPVTRGK